MADSVSILFVIGSLSVGGAERHVSTVARSLNRSRWRPEIFTLSGGGYFAPELEAAGVPVHVPAFATLSGTSPLARGIRIALVSSQLLFHLIRHRPQIVHFFLPASLLLGLPLALATFRPIRVVSRRSLNDYQRKRPVLARMERFLHRWATAVLGNSRVVIRQLAEEGVCPGRLRLIYNGVDLDRLLPESTRVATRERLGISADALVLVMVANLIAYKGHTDLLESLSSARASLPAGWRLLCVGRDDGIGAALRLDAIERGLADNVLWLGERHDVADILAASDIGLLCSHEEGFSNAILEGMAAGLPMIVTDVGGNPEAVLDGETGLVVPPRDRTALSRALARLASDDEARRRFGLAGQQRVKERFSLTRCVADYESLYEALMAGIQLSPGNCSLAVRDQARTPGP